MCERERGGGGIMLSTWFPFLKKVFADVYFRAPIFLIITFASLVFRLWGRQLESQESKIDRKKKLAFPGSNFSYFPPLPFLADKVSAFPSAVIGNARVRLLMFCERFAS